jgi:hypothetical protein
MRPDLAGDTSQPRQTSGSPPPRNQLCHPATSLSNSGIAVRQIAHIQSLSTRLLGGCGLYQGGELLQFDTVQI